MRFLSFVLVLLSTGCVVGMPEPEKDDDSKGQPEATGPDALAEIASPEAKYAEVPTEEDEKKVEPPESPVAQNVPVLKKDPRKDAPDESENQYNPDGNSGDGPEDGGEGGIKLTKNPKRSDTNVTASQDNGDKSTEVKSIKDLPNIDGLSEVPVTFSDGEIQQKVTLGQVIKSVTEGSNGETKEDAIPVDTTNTTAATQDTPKTAMQDAAKTDDSNPFITAESDDVPTASEPSNNAVIDDTKIAETPPKAPVSPHASSTSSPAGQAEISDIAPVPKPQAEQQATKDTPKSQPKVPEMTVDQAEISQGPKPPKPEVPQNQMPRAEEQPIANTGARVPIETPAEQLQKPTNQPTTDVPLTQNEVPESKWTPPVEQAHIKNDGSTVPPQNPGDTLPITKNTRLPEQPPITQNNSTPAQDPNTPSKQPFEEIPRKSTASASNPVPVDPADPAFEDSIPDKAPVDTGRDPEDVENPFTKENLKPSTNVHKEPDTNESASGSTNPQSHPDPIDTDTPDPTATGPLTGRDPIAIAVQYTSVLYATRNCNIPLTSPMAGFVNTSQEFSNLLTRYQCAATMGNDMRYGRRATEGLYTYIGFQECKIRLRYAMQYAQQKSGSGTKPAGGNADAICDKFIHSPAFKQHFSSLPESTSIFHIPIPANTTASIFQSAKVTQPPASAYCADSKGVLDPVCKAYAQQGPRPLSLVVAAVKAQEGAKNQMVHGFGKVLELARQKEREDRAGGGSQVLQGQDRLPNGHGSRDSTGSGTQRDGYSGIPQEGAVNLPRQSEEPNNPLTPDEYDRGNPQTPILPQPTGGVYEDPGVNMDNPANW